MNTIPYPVIRDRQDGECAAILVALNDGDFGSPLLTGWNLKGAELGYSSLHFANLLGAHLQGADLYDFQFGYAQITGTVDSHTQGIPETCQVTGSAILCSN